MNETIDYYNKNANSFYETTVFADMSQQYEEFLKQLSANARVLDLGCGSGRDSKYFLEHGYQVTSLDGSEELCNRASRLIGRKVICKPFQELSFVQEFDGIWACVSLLHVKIDELPNIFKRLSVALKKMGVCIVPLNMVVVRKRGMDVILQI
jgi:cyclopropane fatty-acyl-phospholipid synthase-like methyltransferase